MYSNFKNYHLSLNNNEMLLKPKIYHFPYAIDLNLLLKINYIVNVPIYMYLYRICNFGPNLTLK